MDTNIDTQCIPSSKGFCNPVPIPYTWKILFPKKKSTMALTTIFDATALKFIYVHKTVLTVQSYHIQIYFLG